MAIKASVLKRIETVAKAAVHQKTPDLIWIRWNDVQQQWMVQEQFFIGNYQTKDRVFFYEDFKEYIVPAEYDGTVLINMMDCPEPVDLFSLKAGDVRKEYGIGSHPFSIGYAMDQDEEEQRKHKFNITVFKRV